MEVELGFNNNTFFSRKIGLWNAIARKITAPSWYRNIVGMLGFVNAGGFIETPGILEETPELECEDAIGPLSAPPQMVDSSPTRRHQSGRGVHHQILNHWSTKDLTSRIGECVKPSGKSG